MDNETYDPLDSDMASTGDGYIQGPGERPDHQDANVQSGYVVLRLASNNNSPEFQDPDTDVDQSDTATREVAENTEAGENICAVRARCRLRSKTDLTLGGDSADVFDIDWATGQLKTKAALDEETGPSYTVTVRATDPAGIPQADPAVPDNRRDQVTITVTDVNEPPMPGMRGMPVTFDEDRRHSHSAGHLHGDRSGGCRRCLHRVVDGRSCKFEIDDGALTFKAKPDFEAPTDANKDNVYEVTVRAADADGSSARWP